MLEKLPIYQQGWDEVPTWAAVAALAHVDHQIETYPFWPSLTHV